MYKFKNKMNCTLCGKEVDKVPRRKYCPECSLLVRRENAKLFRISKPTGIKVKCENCGREIIKLKYDIKKYQFHFCSSKCFTELRNANPEYSPGWQGGKSNNNGYTMIYCKSHPNCNKWGYVAEHRLVMEKHLGRYLEKAEVVHHINSVRDDNSLDNLILFKNKLEHYNYHSRPVYILS